MHLPFVNLGGKFQPNRVDAHPVETPGGHSIVKNTGGGWLDSLGSGILVGKRYFGVLQKY